MSHLRHTFLLSAACLLALLAAPAAEAACVNKFVGRSEGARQIVTFLTGKLTFQEAQALAQSINQRQAPALEWVDDKGKVLAKQFGEIKVLRPMPVGCDGKKSGVVMTATFATANTPKRKMNLKINPETTVAFEEQGE